MTVSTSYLSISYSGNGVTTAFPVTWQFLTGSLVVTLISSTGVETVKSLTTHYTVSGGTDSNGLPATGTVTMLTAPASGETLRIQRSTPRTQTLTWGENDAFPQKTIESGFDKLLLIAQEAGNAGTVNDEIGGDLIELVTSGAVDYWDAESHILRNVSDATGNTDAVNYGQLQQVLIDAGAGDVVGPATSTDNNVPRFDGTSGNLLQASAVSIDDSGNVTGVAALTATTVNIGSTSTTLSEDSAGRVAVEGVLLALDRYSSTVPTTPAVLTRTSKDSQRCDLRDWSGLDLTGATNMATLMGDAATQSAAVGAVLELPAGKIKLESAVTIPAGTRMRGNGQPSTWNAYDTYFHFAHTGYGFVIDGGANTRARELSGFGTYRTQPAITGGWAPTAHEWDILIQGASDVVLDRIHLHNATKGICSIGDATNGVNGRLSLTRISGQPFSQGLYMTHCLDAVYIDEVHFWPFFSGTLDATARGHVYTYMRANGLAFSFGRVDNAKVGRLFSYGYYRGLYFFHQAAGSGVLSSISGDTSLFKADTIGCDNSGLGLLTDASTTGVSAVINNFYAGSISADGGITTEPVVYTLGSNGRLEIESLYGYNSNASLVQLGGSSNWVTIGRSRSNGIDADANGTAEFHVATGNNRLRLTHNPENTASTKYVNAGTSIIEAPDWRAYTPTITASSGTFTTVAATGRYYRVTDTMHVQMVITITTNGTAAGTILATLPWTAAQDGIGYGRESASTGVGVNAYVVAGQATLNISKTADNLYAGGSGYVICVEIVYEATTS